MDRKRLVVSLTAAGVCIAMVLVMLFTVPRNEPSRIGICFASLKESEGRAGFLKGYFSEKGRTVSIADASKDQSVQLNQLRQLIRDGCDAIIIEPVMVSAAEEITGILQEANIPAVFIGQAPGEAITGTWANICYVGSDPSKLGYSQGQLILNVLRRGDVNEDGIVSYLMLQDDPQITHTQTRSLGAIQALTDAGTAVTALKTLCGYDDRAESRALCAQSLAELGKDIEVIFCNTDTMALGALEAVLDGGRSVGEDIYIVGIGGLPEVLEKIKTGELTGTVAEDTDTQNRMIAEAVLLLLKGEAPQTVQYVEHLKITKENIALYMD